MLNKRSKGRKDNLQSSFFDSRNIIPSCKLYYFNKNTEILDLKATIENRALSQNQR